MADGLFNLVVCGFLKNVDPAEVKAKFSKMFRLEAAHVERVFNATPIILRRNIPEDFANSLVKRLSAIGVSVQKVNVETAPLLSNASVSKAIYYKDSGETSSDASAMHQPVDFFYAAHERRIPFIFTGDGLAYCKLWLINLLVCTLSVGILYPWAKTRSLSYLCQHMCFDNINFRCVENSKKIYYLHCTLLAFVVALAASFLYSFVYFLTAIIVFVGLFPYYQYKCNQLQYGQFLFCDLDVRPSASLRDTYFSALVWPLLAVLTFGILVPYAAYRIHCSRLQKKYIGNCEFKFLTSPEKYRRLLPSLLVAELIIIGCVCWRTVIPAFYNAPIVLSAIFLVFIHWRVTLEKLRWNNLVSPIGYFLCSWSFISYGKLILQNSFISLITFGLYWPWVKINVTRYKAQHLAFFANPGFSKWQKALNKP
ncbi:MAG: DUF898 family protein [Gammaproteobacteria bacterium]|nr:MAG: DUF898 family protein [Gammaproteobacteria bacterium]